MSEIWIAPRFQRQMDKHLFMNDWYHDRRWPLMLIVHGPKGAGKSTQLRATLAAQSVTTVELAAGRLAGDERVANDELAKAYQRASDYIAEKRRAALVIDDLDLSILSRKDDTSYSQNTQLLSVAFMGLCDNPKKFFDSNVYRVPIFATANETRGLHGPLIRAGRAHIWNWIPFEEERIAITAIKFPFLDRSDHIKLDREFGRQEGFGVLDEILHEALFSIHEQNPAIRELPRAEGLKAADDLLAKTKVRDLIELGRMICSERERTSHL